jgi:ABC-type Fe3+/spermidine/putrescine transport system ATPase subunit
MIQIEDLSINLGEFNLRNIDLQINEGEYMVLLGPTGAGKSVLVECLVGIYRPRAGRMLIDGQDVTHLYPEERNIGYVPQDYALFPNMTVKCNVGYGLKARRMSGAEVERQVTKMMDMLGIAHLHYRLPLNLSGGEKQRVALGRALITQPRALLLDEPLAALDENLRSELAAELHRVQRQFHGTFLHVCHSFEETTDVADRIAIMNEGRLAQVGTIAEVVARPASLFVARFTRTRNLLDGRAEAIGDGCKVHLDGGPTLPSSFAALKGPITAGVRPEDIEILTLNGGHNSDGFPAIVAAIRQKPTCMEVDLDAGVPLIAIERPGLPPDALHPGQRVALYVRPDAVKVFSEPECSHEGQGGIDVPEDLLATVP